MANLRIYVVGATVTAFSLISWSLV